MNKYTDIMVKMHNMSLVSCSGDAFRESILAFQELIAENEKLRKALKPFAELAVAVERQYENCLPSEKHFAGVQYGHLRAAAAALKETE